ncbi:MAG TPA: outer membrane lipoprotein-sorting protein [Chitinispirillaceae bacterium]|nr:outer membrane lipoprotein-sorting protein [Chitinispirillaceae bacterium]
MKEFILGCLIFAGVSASAGVVDSLLVEVEKKTEITSDAQATVSLTQQKTGQGAKTTEMVWYRRDSDDAFMIVMTAPESEKGNGYLRMGENFWMYRKNTRTFQHINRDENIGGSDAQADDFEKRKLTELYQPVLDKDGKENLSEEMLGNIAVYRFEIKAKVNDVDYPKKIFWIRKDNSLVLKEQSFALSGSLMQTAYYLKYTLVDKGYAPAKMMFIDEFEKGNKTIVEISGISTKALDDKLFTKAYLENLSK